MIIEKYIKLMLLLFVGINTINAQNDCRECPGRYCGRTVTRNITACESKCSACARGYRTDKYFCRKCIDLLQLYDWLFLGFMALCVTVLNFYAIDMFQRNGSQRKVWLYHLSALLESIVSFICMILLFEPRGKLSLYSCRVNSITDWYTVFYNPRPNYITIIRCTQEAVYPLYTSIFIYLLFCLLTMVLFRGVFMGCLLRKNKHASLYAGFYIIPIVGLVHTCFAGVIYYIYPYLVLFLSAIGVAVFLTTLDDDFMKALKEPRHIGVLACYCIAHGYGIVSITEFSLPIRDGPVLLLVFLPVGFYTLARPFTDAENFKT